MKTIDIIAGARPNFMKIAPIIKALTASRAQGGSLQHRLIHTGQHYDKAMSGGFFEQLGIPEPDINLEVGSGTQAEQTAAIMVRYEKALIEKRSDLCLVVGDVTSTMACSIVARKLGVPVAHVEGGIRSGDWSMPEEINRVVTDSISNWFFTTSTTANENLRRAGVAEERVFFVGNTMIDTLLAQMPRLQPPDFWAALALRPGQYFVLTLHRPANVDAEQQLQRLLQAIADGTGGLPVVFPVHPRTAKSLRELAGQIPGLHYVDPQGYLEFNYLVKHAKGVITDSGGITEETTVMGVPCLTLRDNTERPETVTVGTNELIGTDPAKLGPALARLMAGEWKKGAVPEKWDGRAAERIVAELQRLLG
ncbi:UDP-N-acetylglucosamine 2-epimerase (non-hydrolyzing) [Candidatus Accumulibacter sp. ACC012]|jgi:UDP-N-acetylglucosamine 2-epimerase (non-hydrolysing)|uniref:non-hydrolyzing UDP-N-acetylglucosamine 2-epimerase n=1 Tax=Candidatus Accumulibacter sp. ACC012 TaxID=2823332 RepID=UPI0025C3A8EC|nr:UDP-N-acetylglucosamine 2-epimerase (non-hydrolyzing) [Candidatus Accumulibacter sp. ACC012]